ncbi:MAG TPA: immunoglobulin domain-containing protein [Verrucomicrobiae bacterium]|nr:immunoglobulin domain-containing protein [Verrucomicrobiae bacterium]
MTVSSFFAPAAKTVSSCCKIAVGVLALMTVFSSSAALFFTDQFAYTGGVNLGSATGGGGATWTLASGDVTQIKVTTASTQTSPGGYATAAGFGVAVTPSGTRKTTGVPFNGATGIPAVDGNVVYASFLLNVQTLPSASLRVAYLNNVAASASAALEVGLSATGQLGVSKKGGTPAFVSGTPFSSPGTHLVVVRYTFQSGADEVAMWVDPTNSSYGVNPAPTTGAYANTTLTADYTSTIQYFIITSEAVTGPVFWIDEVRVATTWAEVTPSNGSTSPTPAPVITQALLAPQGLILRGTNGPPSSAYQVLASTNISWPASNWPGIATRSFDSIGNFDSTNPVSPGSAQQFFRLLVDGTNPPATTAPTITNQPQSLTVAIGANASFLVGAGGSAPLAYFWSFNTNTPVGGNSSTLALLNVQTNDAGSYRVIVSNNVGTATSSVATLTVLIPPTITADPTNLTVVSGGSPAFHVTADGSAPLRYQWYFNNTDTPLTDETNATLTLSAVNTADAGSYFVAVTNPVGGATSSVAALTVLGPPVIESQPESQSVTVSNNATFTVDVAGPEPLTYQWFFNTNTPVEVNSNTLVLLNVQTGNAGTYSVIATNNYGAVTSSFATLTVNTSVLANAQFNLVGFGQATIGGGVIPETDPAYAKVTNALQLANAVIAFNKTGGIKVIEIMNDLDLGWNEIGSAVQTLSSTPFNVAATPKLHPRLITTGVSKLDIKYKNGGLTIFSANGATIRHCTFNIKSTHNIIVRNLKFDEMWEWDETSKGKYDGNDWDFIDLANGGDTYDVWIDHCTFTKAYDGIVDFKAGSTNVTLSWCKYTGDDGATNPNSFVWQQINSLESNKTSYAMYNFLRNNGFSTTNIVTIIQGHDKTHLMGSNDQDPYNVNLSATFHHQWFRNCWDRVVPRLRAGNVHDFNIFVDDTDALAAKRLRDFIVANVVNLSASSSNLMKNTYSFNPPLNGSISTEGGAVLVEKSVYIDCLYPLRNNQTDVTDPTYTGKILGLDMIYQMDSTVVRGDSTDSGSPLGPFQAPVIPFSWNPASGAPNGQLPYTYTMDDPSQLQSIVTSPTSGAGAGVLTWAKTNWLKTAY